MNSFREGQQVIIVMHNRPEMRFGVITAVVGPRQGDPPDKVYYRVLRRDGHRVDMDASEIELHKPTVCVVIGDATFVASNDPNIAVEVYDTAAMTKEGEAELDLRIEAEYQFSPKVK